MSGRHRIPRVLAALASAGALVLTMAAGSASLAVRSLEGNVTTIDISDQVGERTADRAGLVEGPVTFLVMGSDQRTGKGNEGYGSFEGARSDTTMLLRLYPQRDSAVVVSIPRDTVVMLPSCQDANGDRLPRTRDRFNLAFDRGGPGCTVKTVERMTGLEIDHFVVLDFNGFKRTIDALGGVEVCLTRPLRDTQSGVDLPAGRTVVNGEQALGFVRVRHNIGDGSDISRINRQQLFLSSLIQEVTDSGLLTDPMRVWRVLRESSKSIATDAALADSRGLIALASSVSGLRPKDVTFVTLPWLPSGDGATIVTDQPKADAIWTALANNRPWPPPPTKGANGRKLRAVPGDIRIDLHDATGIKGEGWNAAEDLAGQGFVINLVNSRRYVATATTIRHTAKQRQAARTLQAAIPGSVLSLDPQNGSTLDLTLGADYEGVVALKVKASGSAGGSQSGSSAAQDICTG